MNDFKRKRAEIAQGQVLEEGFSEEGQDHAESKTNVHKGIQTEAVHLWQSSGKSQAQIARDLGVPDSMLCHWCLRFTERGKEAFPGKRHFPPLEEENRRLQRENELLRQKRDVLKKLSPPFRATLHKVSVPRRAEPLVFRSAALRGTRRFRERLLRLETP